MTLNMLFYKFYRDFKNFYDEMNDLYALLNAFINTHETSTTEAKYHKDGIIMNYVKALL